MRVKPVLFLAAWSFVFCLFTIFWIFKNTAPPSWDQAHYLEASANLENTLKSQGILAFLDQTTRVIGTKAPLLPILAIPLYLVFESSAQTALLVNILFFVIFVFFFFLLAREFVDEKTAAASVLIVSTMPLFWGLVRNYFVEFGLMTLVVIFLYLLLKSKDFTSKNFMFWLGAVFGLGMMMKFHFFLFIAGPSILVIWQSFKKAGLSRKLRDLKRTLPYFLPPAILIALPWYLNNIKTVLWKAKRATDPMLLGDYYYGPFYSLKNIAGSIADFINFSISSYWFAVFGVLAMILIIKMTKIKINYFLLLWFLVPALVFLSGPNKDYRLLLPALPPFALFISWMLFRLMGEKANFYLVILLIFPVLSWANTTFLKLPLLGDEKIGLYAQRPQEQNWPNEEILGFLDSLEPQGRKTVILASEHQFFNINNLRYFTEKNRLNLEIKSASYFPKETPIEEVLEFARDGDYLIMKKGAEDGPAGLNYFNDDIESAVFVRHNLEWEAVPNNFVFPDGGLLLIAQKL